MRQVIFPLAFVFLLLLSCEREEALNAVGNPAGPGSGDIIRFVEIGPMETEADGISFIRARVRIHPEADASARSIVFSISGGNFPGGDTTQTVTANTDGYASASFTSRKSQPVQLGAKVLNFSTDTLVRFTQAFPDDMLLTANRYLADTSVSVTLTAGLFRNPGRGQVWETAKIYFDVIPDSAHFMPLICPSFALSDPDSAFVTLLNPLHATGSYTIRAKTLAANRDTLRKSIRVVIR